MAFVIQKEISPQDLAAQLKNGPAPVIIDVRETAEWAAGHITGATHIPLGELLQRLNELPQDKKSSSYVEAATAAV